MEEVLVEEAEGVAEEVEEEVAEEVKISLFS